MLPLNSHLVLDGDAIFNIGQNNLSDNAGSILFSKTVAGSATAGRGGRLTVNADGVTNFSHNIGINQSGAVQAIGTIITDSRGSTKIGANITTSGSQTYNDAVLLTADVTLTGVNNIFGGTVNGAHNLIVNDSGTSEFRAIVGGATALTSLTTDAAGSTNIGANVTTTGSQTYNETSGVLFTGDSVLDANAGNITFAGALTSGSTARSLTLMSDGSISGFTDIGTSSNRFSSVSLTNSGGTLAQLDLGNIYTTGDQSYTATNIDLNGNNYNSVDGAIGFTGSVDLDVASGNVLLLKQIPIMIILLKMLPLQAQLMVAKTLLLIVQV